MKFLALFLFAAALSVHARTEAQTITLNVREAKLSVIFQEIKQQTGYNFFYNESMLKAAKPVTVNIKEQPLQNALAQCFAGQPFSYVIMDKMIIVKEKEPNEQTNTSVKKYVPPPPDKVISGQVTDSLGKPLSGVSVSIIGTNKGTITNINGNYMLSADKENILEFNNIGYQTQRITVGNQTEIDVKMKLLPNDMADVVVVGYGIQKKESVVGAVTTINPEELVQSNSELSQGFAGRLSGVIAVSPSGQPGSNTSNFWIRGVATLGNTTPLVFLDGIEISISDMNSIDPSNIETFSILKDATATALYGAKGANGVLLITTKHGRITDKPNITGLVENTVNEPTKIVKFVNGPTYMELYNEASINNNPYAPLKYSQEQIEGTEAGLNPYVFPNVDWYDNLFSKYSTAQHANVNIRGGGKTARYYSGASFYNQYGVLRNAPQNNFNNNILNQRFNFVNNIDVNVTSSTVVELNLNADFVKYNGPATSPSQIFSEVMNSNPVNFPMTYPTPDSATHIYFGNTTGGFYANNTFQNPYADMVDGYTQSFYSTILANLRLTQQFDFITKGLSFNAIASIKNYSYSSIVRSYTPYFYMLSSYSPDPSKAGIYDYTINQIGSGGQEALSQTGGTSGDRTIYLQAAINYARTFGDHSVTGLLVYQQQEYDLNNPDNSITDVLPQRNQGVSGRVTYNYKSKYFLEGNFGYTGSENFAPGHKWGFFPSIGAGWMISNEKFFKPVLPVVNSWKIRASYGLSGNDQLPTGRFPYLGTVNLNAGNGFTFGQNFNNSYSGVQITQFANPDIQWEVSHKLNIGTDIGLFNALTLNVDWYREMRNKIFQQRATVPSTVGVGTIPIYGNIDEVVNKGIDMSLDYHKQINSQLFVSVKGTFTYAHNVVEKYDEPNYLYPNLFQTGRPVNQLWGLEAERLFIDQNEINNSPVQTFYTDVSPGDLKYKSVSNQYDGLDRVSNNDMVPMGHPSIPEITYGFGFNVIYKKFDLGIFFQGVGNVSFFINSVQPFGQYQSNVLQAIADDHWSPTNQNIYAFYPRLSLVANPNNTQNSSWWLRNPSFLRLKNAELGYTFYKKIFRVYLSGQDLLTFSSFKLWDPELSIGGAANGLSYPPQRQMTAGIQVNIH